MFVIIVTMFQHLITATSNYEDTLIFEKIKFFGDAAEISRDCISNHFHLHINRLWLRYCIDYDD